MIARELCVVARQNRESDHMFSKVYPKTRRPTARNFNNATVALIRKLVARAIHAPEMRGGVVQANPQRAVLFACEVDGVRCTLMKTEPSPPESQHTTLSPRESEIVRMIAKGYPNKAIAGVLEISVWTVSTHLRRVFAKLGVSSRAAMVAKIVSAPDPAIRAPILPAGAKANSRKAAA
jgi:DNA-binding CsgD family transcriptional regulator